MLLVTGGAGFIGSVLAKAINQAGEKQILIVDRLRTSTKWKNLRAVSFCDFVHADEFFNASNQSLHKKIKGIFHLGACSSTTEMDADYLMRNNVDFSKKIFILATKLGVPLIYASSAATYGEGEQGYDDNHKGVNDLRPLNPYGYSKQIFDQWALSQKSTPPRWKGIKFFNVFGPNEYHKSHMASMVFRGFKQIKERGTLRLFKSHKEGYADGEQLRDFIYVKDCVQALLKMMETGGKNCNGLYNLGSGEARSFNALAQATFAALNLPPSIEYIDMPEGLRNQYQYYTQANMQKFKKLLPKFTFSSLESAVKDYVCSYLNTEDQYY